MKMEQGQRDDTWKRVERYLNQKTNMAAAVSYLNMAIRALCTAGTKLAYLPDYPKVGDGTLRSELRDHEDRLVEIRDLLIETQVQLRKDARNDFSDRTDRMGEEE